MKISDKSVHLDSDVIGLLCDYKALLEKKREVELLIDTAKKVLLSIIAERGTLVSPDGEIVGSITSQSRSRLDIARLKEENEEIFREYSVKNEIDVLRVL